ncbi:molybdopterin molybdotransferase MoeA [Aurantiacibacter suaedae]|uniref:molybdopterin molybdotransferase MoeA n=1 Tax=Aurantiacibacter suaedae TaxID=2545755 RepID=UPI0010F59862|nr:molybdopterin molybdotransferase MoeA [Aurantiacibacter suaedae]
MSLPPPIPHEEAQARLLAMAAPLGSERVPTDAAAGRYLAEPLLARRTQPPADLSAMDGYAVRADELSGPWQVVGESAAGHPFGRALAPGEAIRISTGALMPPGEAAVLLQENAEREGDALSLTGDDAATPRHIRRKGLDFAQGKALLDAGTRLTPAAVALALAGGHGALDVGRLPRIAVLDSGDELAADPEAVEPHQIPASNGAMLAAMCKGLVSGIDRLGPVPDTMEAMRAALAQAGEADVLVTSGGASVGDHDLVRPALEEWGAEIAFWRIAMKPGKPLLIARKGAQFVVGLPGNPVSSMVTAYLFLLPLLRRLAGAAQPLPRAITLPTRDALPATGGRAEFVRARMGDGGVTLLGQQDSSALRALAASEALIARPAHADEAMAGDMVPVYLLSGGGWT